MKMKIILLILVGIVALETYLLIDLRTSQDVKEWKRERDSLREVNQILLDRRKREGVALDQIENEIQDKKREINETDNFIPLPDRNIPDQQKRDSTIRARAME